MNKLKTLVYIMLLCYYVSSFLQMCFFLMRQSKAKITVQVIKIIGTGCFNYQMANYLKNCKQLAEKLLTNWGKKPANSFRLYHYGVNY